ncbi:MAG: hypothetical protein ABIO93_07530 [Dyadobacter sp.]|uniref:hypothetical protein n=1 Tax=Dyadobacter sp. TaxID=1914288 RepID=UPI00326517A9
MKNGLLYTGEELAIGLKDNDRTAYEYFYDRYGPAMYGVIYRLVLKDEIANTVMIEAFLEFKIEMCKCEYKSGSILSVALNISRNKAHQYMEMLLISNEDEL